MESTAIIFPGNDLSYPISKDVLLQLNTSQGYYRGVVHFRFQTGEVNDTTGSFSWANHSAVAIGVVFQCGPYVASNWWINASNSSVEGALSFNLSWIDAIHYAAYLLIPASSPNSTSIELFPGTPLSIWRAVRPD